MKTFVAILALSAVLLVGIHTAFADEPRVDERDHLTPAAPLYLGEQPADTQASGAGSADVRVDI